ncbi:MAG: dTDP-4-dehydrorhamnose reductase [Candidatus Omnitrophica bacterium]|nr:dTDP-4-dehydrorhamnose reductase [Candidatus Omnitrophota bacterium]MBU1656610.1 dTDP-4-dehydrorhamnose reductase [Candidatus Omnitrophota bacterium]MBU1783857.1 dTDP-4-dehydrorhamnose reductase [Candidatus Omnitrophota bacterium]MBU1851499.1 dTDP-4-dehydrorhamnose reductase [Candidatus Omnitrophota bacterium]
MKILVTGSSGMLGTDLCDVLADKHDVVGIDIARGKGQESRVKKFHEVDITELEAARKVIEAEQPDIIVHAAAWTDVDGCEREQDKAEKINVEGTRNIASVSELAGIPVVLVSTDYVFDGEKTAPYVESDLPGPLGVYGRTKLESEKIVMKSLTYYVIVRTSWLYGRYGRNFVDTIVTKGETGEKLEVVEDQTASPTYTKDLANALKRIIASGVAAGQEILHISNAGQCSWCEFAKKILALKNINTEVKGISSERCGRPAKRPGFSVLDNGRFNKLLGCQMRPWQEALAEYLGESHGAR